MENILLTAGMLVAGVLVSYWTWTGRDNDPACERELVQWADDHPDEAEALFARMRSSSGQNPDQGAS